MLKPTPSNSNVSSKESPYLSAIQMLSSTWISRMVYLGVKRNIFKLIADGSKTIDQLITKLDIDPEVLSRVLKGMKHLGLLDANEENYDLTTISRLFVPNTPGNLCSMAILWGEEFSNSWGEIESAILDNTSGFQKFYKMDLFSYLSQHHKTAESFDKAMESLAFHIYPSIAKALPLIGIKQVVDVGGGSGFLARTINEIYKDIEVTVFDLDHVIERAKNSTSDFDKINFISGNFFTEVPASNLHILANIIHDWNDEDALKILKTIKKAQTNQGILCLIEMVIDHPNEPSLARSTDLNMLMLTGGKERSKEELSLILKEAGFFIENLINIENATCLVIARHIT